MAYLSTTTPQDSAKAATTSSRPAKTDGNWQASAAGLAFSTMSVALSAAILAEKALYSASSQTEYLSLVDASDAAVSEAIAAALCAARESIRLPADRGLVFSAQLISYGLGIESSTDRDAFLQSLMDSETYWAADEQLGTARFAVCNAIAQLVCLSDLIYRGTVENELEMGNPDVDLPTMDCAA